MRDNELIGTHEKERRTSVRTSINEAAELVILAAGQPLTREEIAERLTVLGYLNRQRRGKLGKALSDTGHLYQNKRVKVLYTLERGDQRGMQGGYKKGKGFTLFVARSMEQWLEKD